MLPPQEVRAVLEALIFASPQPITPREITQVLGGVPKEAWQAALEELQADYARDGRGLQLVEVAGGLSDHHPARVQRLDPRAARPQESRRASRSRPSRRWR